MAFNELEAARMLDDGKLTDAEIKLLTRVRDGLAFDEVRDDKELNVLLDKGLVSLIDLSHPRARVAVQAVIATEEGTTVLNLFDKRFRENVINTSPDANTAPDVDPKLVKAPTEEEARKQPHLDMKPLAAEDKAQAYPDEFFNEQDKAMKDPLVAAGARDVSRADSTNEKVLTDNAKIVVDGSAFDHDANGKVGGSTKKK